MDERDTFFEQLQRPRDERRAMGKQLRKDVPRSSHGAWAPAADRPDPLELLQAQDEGRVKELLPIKYGRMVASPFAFLRGSAVVMAADLASTPVTGQPVILCGDAHISNFGLFASPERKLVFDVNDFDECTPGPWEWDVKRLAASVVVAARENGLDHKTAHELAQGAVEVYRRSMSHFAAMPTTDIWYYHVDAGQVQELFDEKASKKARKMTKKTIDKAMTKTQGRTLEKLTHLEDGRRRINSEPPLLLPLRELDIKGAIAPAMSDEEFSEMSTRSVLAMWQQYLDSLPEDRQYLLERYRVTDVALRVGGVGSVGTRCFIALLEGGGDDEGLILQLKQAGPSALSAYLPPRAYKQQAERVVHGQMLMQATSDPFLGWHQSEKSGTDFYWRQLKDMKGSFEAANLDESGLQAYIAICALCLARAHARTGDATAISGYLGKSDVFDKAIADFADAYAGQTVKDHAALRQAIDDGRIPAQEGV